MIICLTKYNRELLTKQEKEFLKRLIPLSMKIQEWTKAKAQYLGLASPRGILASIILADILYISDWGKHPISKPEFNNKYSNNLSLLETPDWWKGKYHEYEGKRYRAYRDWSETACDLSDHYVFSRLYDLPLACWKEVDQIKSLSLTKRHYKQYIKKISDIIDQYYLSEFNK